MKTLNKILLFDIVLTLIFRITLNVNMLITFLTTLIFYGIFIIVVSIKGALNVKNADLETIERYTYKLNKYM